MATTVSLSVTKNSDGSYTFVSGDTTNAKAWGIRTGAADILDDLSSVKNAVWAEILRQVKQI